MSSQPTHTPTPFALALTGGIACGKSTVGAILRERGLERIDSDAVARAVVEPGSLGLEAVRSRFGDQVIASDGTLDRRSLGRLVFASTPARRDLEAILHPLIWRTLSAEMAAAAAAERETVFEIPLLFENGNQGRFATVWVVSATPDVQLARLIQREGLDPVEAQARLDSQMSVAEKAARANYVIVNDGDPLALEHAVDAGLYLWRLGRAPR